MAAHLEGFELVTLFQGLSSPWAASGKRLARITKKNPFQEANNQD